MNVKSQTSPCEKFDFQFRSITASETHEIRQAVLWPDKPVSHVMVQDDEQARHFAAYQDNDVIGVASFFGMSPTSRLQKLAVKSEFQSCGIGSALLMHAAPKTSRGGVQIAVV